MSNLTLLNGTLPRKCECGPVEAELQAWCAVVHARNKCPWVCATVMQVKWCLLLSPFGLLSLLKLRMRGKTFLLTLVMKIVGNLRFPVERTATTATARALLVRELRLECRVNYLTRVGSVP